MRSYLFLAAPFILVAASVLPATGAVIDFEDLGVPAGTQFEPADGATVTSGGFDFVNGPLNSFQDMHFPNASGNDIAGTTELVTHEDIIMSPNGGGTFTLNQFDWGSSFDEDGVFTVYGELFGGGTVSQVFALDGDETTFQTFVLPGTFTNLVSVKFEHIGGITGIQNIDNIVVNQGVAAVPEPMSMAIWGLGAVGLFGVKRLRRKKA